MSVEIFTNCIISRESGLIVTYPGKKPNWLRRFIIKKLLGWEFTETIHFTSEQIAIGSC